MANSVVGLAFGGGAQDVRKQTRVRGAVYVHMRYLHLDACCLLIKYTLCQC